jgi:hypothetical protein
MRRLGLSVRRPRPARRRDTAILISTITAFTLAPPRSPNIVTMTTTTAGS